MLENLSLINWLEQAKSDPKIAAQPLIIIVAMFFLGWKFLYSPQKVLLTKELKRKQGIEAEIRNLEKAIEDKENIELEVADLKKQIEEARSKCYKQSEAHQFLQDIRAIAKKSNLEVRGIAPLPMVAKSLEGLNYSEFPVKITFQGNFQKLGIFLRNLELFDKVIKVDLPVLAPDASGTFKFDINPTALVVPDEFVTEVTTLPEGE